MRGHVDVLKECVMTKDLTKGSADSYRQQSCRGNSGHLYAYQLSQTYHWSGVVRQWVMVYDLPLANNYPRCIYSYSGKSMTQGFMCLLYSHLEIRCKSLLLDICSYFKTRALVPQKSRMTPYHRSQKTPALTPALVNWSYSIGLHTFDPQELVTLSVFILWSCYIYHAS